ncbi:MAG TPA: RNA 3'-terminal phosphate cyclase [Tepidisphaeraceae bacterium]|jgi:RNA 3'-terminal phosphate cyclase (ATP)|nr:RNA 3'-terminal phosphate cyclase [Tepidisphaeraceae bacterium]
MIHIDGSQGEGGGQILRSALALSALTGQPFRIENIRAGREKPGLMRQHLTAVNAAAAICSATVDGAAIASRELSFFPKSVKAGDYTFSVGSAGSTTLVLQTVLPPLMLAESPSSMTLEGGTHNIHAPPLDFLEQAFLPIVSRMGAKVGITLERAGFYPAGGGRFFAKIEPVKKLQPIELIDRGPITHRLARAVCAALPGEIALRELEEVRKSLGWPQESLDIRQLPDSQGPGNILTLSIGSANVTEVFTGFGQRGVSAESVAQQAISEAKAYLAAGAPVGDHLADQLILPMALAGGGSFVTRKLSMHARTNIDVVKRFIKIDIQQSELPTRQCRVDFR